MFLAPFPDDGPSREVVPVLTIAVASAVTGALQHGQGHVPPDPASKIKRLDWSQNYMLEWQIVC